jgi:hypothetical protein
VVTSTDSGRVTAGVPNDPTATHTLRASTGRGDVRITTA